MNRIRRVARLTARRQGAESTTRREGKTHSATANPARPCPAQVGLSVYAYDAYRRAAASTGLAVRTGIELPITDNAGQQPNT